MTHAQGGLKNVPPMARVIPVINKVESEAQLLAARVAARAMLAEPRVERVLITAAERPQPLLEHTATRHGHHSRRRRINAHGPS